MCGEGEGGRAELEGSWRHLSDGTPYLTTGRMEFVETAGSSLLSERAFTTRRLLPFEPLLTWRIVLVLLSFSNRCLSCSDKTRSTTWLHPRTGEPVNSGHMIRSGTRQTIWFVGHRGDFFFFFFFPPCCNVISVCGGSFNVVFVRVVDLPRGWEEGFTDEGASYFIKWVSLCALSPCLTV